MTLRNTTRTCPYCGSRLLLDELPIVCTARPVTAATSSWDDDPTDNAWLPPSEARSHGMLGGYPVLLPGGSQIGRLARTMTRLPRPSEIADAMDMPRRACVRCARPLPEDLDDCDAYLLAVTGLNRAGKTFFLGSSLVGAASRDGLTDYGVEVFEPVEDTAGTLHRDYRARLFPSRFATRDVGLESTAVLAHVEKSPLIFRVKLSGGRPFLLFTHDISGEALMSNQLRAVTATFLRRADAVIFIADPLDIDEISWRLPVDVVLSAGGGDRDLDQAALLEAILHDIHSADCGTLPHLAVALSKSDLIEEASGHEFRFSRPPAADWREDVRAVDTEVRHLLQQLGEIKLMRIAESYRRASFHAMSVLGRQADRDRRGGNPAPLRVMDPLAMALDSLRPLVGAE